MRTKNSTRPHRDSPPKHAEIHNQPQPEPSALLAEPPPASEEAPEAQRVIVKAKSRGATVHVSDKTWQRLQEHASGPDWTAERILDELVCENLHGAYPLVTYRTVPLASVGIYRSFDRASLAPDMILKGDRGRFVIRTRRENPEYSHWLEVYQKRDDPKAHEKACEMCVFSLKQCLEKFDTDGAARIIYPEDFLVEQMA